MSRPLRIAYVINSLEGGGAASPVPAVLSVLRDGGAEVAVFALTPRDRRGEAAMLAAGIDVTVRDGGTTDHLAALRWLDRTLTAWRPTHVWTSLSRATLLGQLVGLRRGWPVVSWQHAAFLKPANRRLLRATQRLSCLWVGDSPAVTRLTAERLKVPAARLTQWSIFRANPDAPQGRPWQPGEPIRIGSLGRLHPVKGYDVLVEALAMIDPAQVPAFEVIVAGDGAARDMLEQRAAALGVTTLRFPGYAPRPADFLAGLHLYVQPSRSEGLCIAAHEAMQAGSPIIASAVGELPGTVVQGDTGLLVPPGDPAALADALRKLLSQPDRLAGMGQRGRARVLDRFGPERFVAAGRAILHRLRAQ
ncbi:Glycosyltransferase involved in cell wall bisynthesis [Sphingomonas gellani]|uniref:Glycosyltransferase involved in cell wall bisynthesis n=1 Tax=Sphingomonas gellani TaxID=1166340 RepID=A0A1H8B2V2_9SPHN|nr:glycosyltransferase family 4 protein [Sphingomonas gellani]SEM76424.1 Glycosyltransferase involved in cell wall bisynthesis [Sphingomonas gellani]